MQNNITTQVVEQLEALPENLQRQVLEFIQALQLLAQHGVSGKQLLQFAGTIPLEDLELMRETIEDSNFRFRWRNGSWEAAELS